MSDSRNEFDAWVLTRGNVSEVSISLTWIGWQANEARNAEKILLLREALLDAVAHLAAATSAYEAYAGKLGRRSVQDALYSTRLSDFNKSLARTRKALVATTDITEPMKED